MVSAVCCGAAEHRLDSENREPDHAGFRQSITPLLRSYCLDCHDDEARSGDLSLADLPLDYLTDEANLETWRMVREQVAFGDMPPADASQPSTAERTRLLGWLRDELRKPHLPGAVVNEKLALPQFGNYVDHGALFGRRLDRVYPAPPRLWRLRADIYDATIPRLAERVDGLANGLNGSDDAEFKDYAARFYVDEAATPPLLRNAKAIAAVLVSDRSKDRPFKALVDPTGAPTDDQIDEAIGYGFRKILGRGATAEERARFTALYDQLKTRDYQLAARTLLAAILMQPEVLFRQELGNGQPDAFGRVRLRGREIAFALSYALDNEPVAEFVEAAERDELATSDQIATLVRKRLEDDTLLQQRNPRVLQFFREYFNYPHAREVFKDMPEGGAHDSDRLVADLETTVRDILRSDREVLSQLLTTRDFYVDAQYRDDQKSKTVTLHKGHQKWSAYHTAYNLPLDWKWSAHLQPVRFANDERAGVLTHPAWLAAWSGNFENHPVQRGKWIRTHLLGGTVPDVPIGVDARVPEKEHTTFRERLRLATQDAACWRCHRKMDPLGLPLERYDHYGRYQRRDAGQPVDASGRIDRTGVASLDGRTVPGPTEMMELLARNEHVEQVFVRHAFRYFLGRNETLGDANTLQDAHRAYRAGGGSFRQLVVSLLSSDSFLLRMPPTRDRRP